MKSCPGYLHVCLCHFSFSSIYFVTSNSGQTTKLRLFSFLRNVYSLTFFCLVQSYSKEKPRRCLVFMYRAIQGDLQDVKRKTWRKKSKHWHERSQSVKDSVSWRKQQNFPHVYFSCAAGCYQPECDNLNVPCIFATNESRGAGALTFSPSHPLLTSYFHFLSPFIPEKRYFFQSCRPYFLRSHSSPSFAVHGCAKGNHPWKMLWPFIIVALCMFSISLVPEAHAC